VAAADLIAQYRSHNVHHDSIPTPSLSQGEVGTFGGFMVCHFPVFRVFRVSGKWRGTVVITAARVEDCFIMRGCLMSLGHEPASRPKA
jgi:hypothetical protein